MNVFYTFIYKVYNTLVISIIVVSWYGATCKGLNMWYNLVKLRGIQLYLSPENCF